MNQYPKILELDRFFLKKVVKKQKTNKYRSHLRVSNSYTRQIWPQDLHRQLQNTIKDLKSMVCQLGEGSAVKMKVLSTWSADLRKSVHRADTAEAIPRSSLSAANTGYRGLLNAVPIRVVELVRQKNEA